MPKFGVRRCGEGARQTAVLTLLDGCYDALDARLMGELTWQLEALASDPCIGSIVLAGAASAFAPPESSAVGAGPWSDQSLKRHRKPILAPIDGPAAGGGWELALMCDYVIVSEVATFSNPPVLKKPACLVLEAIGKPRAKDLLLTHRVMNAGEALRCGFVSCIVPAARLMPVTLQMAHALNMRGLRH